MKIENYFKNIFNKLFSDSEKKESLVSDKKLTEKPVKCFACPKSFDCDCYRYGCICRKNECLSDSQITEKKEYYLYDECGCDIYTRDVLNDRKTYF